MLNVKVSTAIRTSYHLFQHIPQVFILVHLQRPLNIFTAMTELNGSPGHAQEQTLSGNYHFVWVHLESIFLLSFIPWAMQEGSG